MKFNLRARQSVASSRLLFVVMSVSALPDEGASARGRNKMKTFDRLQQQSLPFSTALVHDTDDVMWHSCLSRGVSLSFKHTTRKRERKRVWGRRAKCKEKRGPDRLVQTSKPSHLFNDQWPGKRALISHVRHGSLYSTLSSFVLAFSRYQTIYFPFVSYKELYTRGAVCELQPELDTPLVAGHTSSSKTTYNGNNLFIHFFFV
jgi:hypothetical protein